MICKYEPFWQEISVMTAILRWPLWPVSSLYICPCRIFKQFGFFNKFFYNLFINCVVQSSKDLSMWLKYFRAFLITNCPLSVVVVIVVGVVVVLNFSHFRPLLQNHRTNFSQTWRKASLGEGEMKGPPFSKGR